MTHQLLKQAIAQKLLEKEARPWPYTGEFLPDLYLMTRDRFKRKAAKKAADKASKKASEEAAEKAVKAAKEKKIKRAAELAGYVGAAGLGGAISASLVGKKEKKKSK